MARSLRLQAGASAIIAANLPGSWSGGKCRLAKVTIASGFGGRIDRSYGISREAYKVPITNPTAYRDTIGKYVFSDPAVHRLDVAAFGAGFGLQWSAAFLFSAQRLDACSLSERERNCNFVEDRPAAW